MLLPVNVDFSLVLLHLVLLSFQLLPLQGDLTELLIVVLDDLVHLFLLLVEDPLLTLREHTASEILPLGRIWFVPQVAGLVIVEHLLDQVAAVVFVGFVVRSFSSVRLLLDLLRVVIEQFLILLLVLEVSGLDLLALVPGSLLEVLEVLSLLLG